MTGNFRHCGLSHYLQKRLRFCTYVAYGVAPELSTAKSSALEALREGVYRKAVYAVVEDSLVGPLMPETEPLKQVPLDEDGNCREGNACSGDGPQNQDHPWDPRE